MMERSPRDFKKPKFAESGKPDLKTPLSTIAKFRGGTSNSSPPLSESYPAPEPGETGKQFPTVGDGGASVTAHTSPPQFSTMDFAQKF